MKRCQLCSKEKPELNLFYTNYFGERKHVCGDCYKIYSEPKIKIKWRFPTT